MRWLVITVCPECWTPYESKSDAQNCLCVFGKVGLSHG